MLKHSYSDIKNFAKERVNNRFGDALLILLVPGIIVFVITIFTGIMTSFLGSTPQLISDNVIRRVLNIGATFASTFMIIRFARGRDGFTLDGLFDKPKQIIHFFGFNILSALIGLLAFLPLREFIFDMYPTFTSTTDPSAIAAVITENIIENQSLLSDIYLVAMLSVLTALIMVKFRFTSFLIVDGDNTIIEAMKKSWVLTNGNYFRIFFFPFAFIGWILLTIITCGIAGIYVIPLMETGRAYLYLSILKENDGGDTFVSIRNSTTSSSLEEIDPLFE